MNATITVTLSGNEPANLIANAAARTYGYDSVLAAIVANNGVAIDDHDRNHGDGKIKVKHVGCYKNKAVLLMENTLFCLNAMYVDVNGVAHMSANSIGGNVITRNTTIEQAVANFNDQITTFNPDMITETVSFVSH